MYRYAITKEGFRALEKELSDMRTIQRPDIIKSISRAREHGDLSENAEYHAAKERQAIVEAKIRKLEGIKERCEVINYEDTIDSDVRFGASVQLLDMDLDKELSYKIVSEYESDVSQGLIAITSPLARSLLGRSSGDEIEFNTPKKNKIFKVLNVNYF